MSETPTMQAEPVPAAIAEQASRPRQPMVLDSRRPWRLDARERVLQVITGHVDIFAILSTGGKSSSGRHHLFRVETGGMIFGLPLRGESQAECVDILAVGGQGAEVMVTAREDIDGLG